MHFKKYLALLFVSFISLTMLISQAAVAQNGGFDDTLKEGIYEFRHENYDEALVIFNKLFQENPKSSLVAYYLGLTYKRQENCVESRHYLELAVTLTPKIKGALIELIDTLYRLGDLDEAKEWLAVAENEGVRPAQASFLKGLTLLKSGEYREAITSFDDAKSLDIELTKSADYHIAIAYVKLNRYIEARDIFRNLSDIDPESDVANYAFEYARVIDKKLEKERPLHLRLRFAFEYDTNVLLMPSDSPFAIGITDTDDTREVWSLGTDYTIRTRDNRFSLKAGYDFVYSMENELTRYNLVANQISLIPSINYEKFMITFPCHVNHTIADSKNYLVTADVSNLNNFLIAPKFLAQAGVIYKNFQYLRPPHGAEDRSGNDLAWTSGLFYFFSDNEGVINLRYTMDKNWSKGSNWEYLGNRASAGIVVPLLKKLKLNVQGELFLQNFNHVNTIFDKKRSDQIYSVSSLLTYEVFKNTEIQIQYTYVNDRSNISLYAYDRQVISSAVQYKF